MGISQVLAWLPVGWLSGCCAENGVFSHLLKFASWDKGLVWMWPNFKLDFSGKAVVAKTIPAPQKKAVTSKKAESSSDSDSGNSRNQFLILLC